MKNNKICFIYCVNNERLYAESIKYIQSLYVPDGFEIDILAVRDAESMTAGYNAAMKSSDAKYKVYLHQDTLIINKNFLFDVLNMFQKNPKLGLLGMAGAKELAVNGVWWESVQKFGQVYESNAGKMALLAFDEVQGEYEKVEGIDGFIMITQEDVEWRWDLFKGWHFYDISQSFEFKRAGFEVGVPKQDLPWCIHDCGIVDFSNGYEENREIFLKEYVNNFLPLVSILIPAYNKPHYLELALQSALGQTYKNIEIIVCDDSTNDEVKIMIQPYLTINENIQYYKNEVNLGLGNYHKLFDLSSGKYIAYLNDDDLFHVSKVEKMVAILENNKNITLVTSYRKLIDDIGNEIEDTPLNKLLFNQDGIFNGKDLGSYFLSNTFNGIGEPSVPIFRKLDLEEIFGFYNNFRYGGISDFASWLSLMSKGKVCYLVEPLSYFRIHSSQTSKETDTVLTSIVDWLQLIKDSRKFGFLSQEKEYKLALKNYLMLSVNSIWRAVCSNDEEKIKQINAEQKIAEAVNLITEKNSTD